MKTIYELMQETTDPFKLGQYSVLEMRGVEYLCEKCHGVGVRAYGNTSGWRGGIGGQVITSDTCDSCWGTGDEYRHGVNLRQLRYKSVGEVHEDKT